MENIRHSDLLDALSVVDNLRRNDASACGEYDFQALRDRLEAGVRAYYTEHGIAVDNALIDKGVGEYLANRFAFSSPKLSFFQRLGAGILVRRLYWPLLCCLVLGLGWLGMGFVYDPFLSRSVREAVGIWQEGITQVDDWCEHYQCENLRFAGSVCEASMSEAQAVAAVFQYNLEHYGAASIPLRAPFYAARKNVEAQKRALDASLAAATGLIQVEARLASAEAGVLAWEKEYPQVRTTWDNAVNALNRGADSTSRLNELELALGQIPLVEKQLQELDDILAQFQKLSLKGEDNEFIQSLADAERQNLKLLKPVSLNRLHEYLELAKTPLTLHITISPDVPTGVTRTYGSQSHAYYLVAEARDGRGRSFPIRVTNVENGEEALVERFGIRVALQQYEQVKQDKLDDGIIDNTLLGEKKAGELRFTYTIPVLDGMITSW